MAMLPASSAARRRWVLMLLMRALVWLESVTMPTWAPVKLIAFSPKDWIAMAIKAMEICSPVERSMSISRAGGSSLISLASSMSSSVVSPRALTTTMTWLPAFFARIALRAALMIRSLSATLLPPNFCTTKGTGGISSPGSVRPSNGHDMLALGGIQGIETPPPRHLRLNLFGDSARCRYTLPMPSPFLRENGHDSTLLLLVVRFRRADGDGLSAGAAFVRACQAKAKSGQRRCKRRGAISAQLGRAA